MSRADVHYALAIDTEIWEASQVDRSLLDPIVRVESLPGQARPFTVVRDYQGPHGTYLERFVIRDAKGTVLFESRPRRVTLIGEHDEMRVTSKVDDLVLRRGDEHEVAFVIDDEEISSIPMFLEVGEGGDPTVAVEETFTKALQKGAVLWLVTPAPAPRRGWFGQRKDVPRRGLVYSERHQPVWFIYDDDKVYVFSGPTEQEIEGLQGARQVDLVARSKDHRSQVVRVPADVRVIPPDDPLFDKIGGQGMGRRLNLPDGEGALERWRTRCTLFELTPRFGDLGGGAAGDGQAAAAAAPAPAEEPASAQAKPARPEDEIHVEAQIDQAVFDQLLAEGKSERVARAKAKAAYVRAEKKRILGERQAGAEGE